MRDIKLIAMDLDGTLLQPDNTILPETLAALKEINRRGIITAIASGRFPENASLTFIDYGLTGPVIGSNGAMIEDAPMGNTIFLHSMRSRSAYMVAEILEQFHADYILYTLKRVTTCRTDLRHHSEIKDGQRIHEMSGLTYAHGYPAIKETIRQGVCKFFVMNHPELPAIADAINVIPGIHVTRSGLNNLEIMPEGVHKGRGITELARFLNIPLSQVMAFGDEYNDLTMLSCVGMGIAMGNAPVEVREKCAFTTVPSDQNGIARAIEKYIL